MRKKKAYVLLVPPNWTSQAPPPLDGGWMSDDFTGSASAISRRICFSYSSLRTLKSSTGTVSIANCVCHFNESAADSIIMDVTNGRAVSYTGLCLITLTQTRSFTRQKGPSSNPTQPLLNNSSINSNSNTKLPIAARNQQPLCRATKTCFYVMSWSFVRFGCATIL